MTVPCGTSHAHLTRDTTKDASKVTCGRCIKWLRQRDNTQWSEATPNLQGHYWRKNPMGNTKVVFITDKLDVMTVYGGFQHVSEYPQGGFWAGPISPPPPPTPQK